MLPKSSFNKLCVISKSQKKFLSFHFVALLIKRVWICAYLPMCVHVHVASPLWAQV